MKRRTYFALHQWVGLSLAAFVVLSAVTGAVLLFRSNLKDPPPVAPEVAKHVPLETIVTEAVAAGDGSPATDIALPLESGQPYTVWLDDDAETQVFLDGNAEVLGTREAVGSLTRVLFELHTGALLGAFGTVLSLLTGLGLTVLTASGLLMLLARRRARRKS